MAYPYPRLTWQSGMYETPDAAGVVLEHREVASRMLGRRLRKGETVHHADEDKWNNAPGNLMVFATTGDHSAYHAGGELIPVGDGTFRCSRKERPNARSFRDPEAFRCSCGQPKSAAAVTCWNCYVTDHPTRSPDANDLRRLVWEMPTTDIARLFGVTDTAVAKWCRKHEIPKPPRGWWTGKVHAPHAEVAEVPAS